MSAFTITGTITDADGSKVDFTAIDTPDYNKVIAMSGMGSVGALQTSTVLTVLPTAPAVNHVQPVSSPNSLFTISNNGTSLSNNLTAFGTSAYGSGFTVSIYLNSVLQGTTTTNSSGQWSFPLGVQGDATYTMTATITVSGNASLPSSNFIFTIAPGLTNLPVGIGQNIPNGNHFNWGANQYQSQHSGTSPASCVVVSTHELHFIDLIGDSWPSDPSTNRTEIESGTTFANGTMINITYEFMLDPNYGPFDDGIAPINGSCLTTQVHEDNTIAARPVLACIEWGQGTNGDSPYFVYDNGSAYVFTFSGLPNIGRGIWHNIEFNVKPGPSSSILKIILNGTTWVNATNLNGSGTGAGYYNKHGVYRGTAGRQDVDQGMYLRNLLVVYT